MSRACPICRSGEKNILAELCTNMGVLGTHFPQVSSYNVVCKRCGCVFVDSDATQVDFTKYYQSPASTGIDYATMFGQRQTSEYFEHIFDAIGEHIRIDSRILDCGCGIGEFCSFMYDKGYTNILGVDPSGSSINKAKEKGIACLEADAFTISSETVGLFDCIIFSHVVEHIWDAYSALSNLLSLLRPGGIIYIEVPDALRYCDVAFSPYFFTTYEHVTHYTSQTMENIARVLGLDLLDSAGYLKAESYYVRYAIYRPGGKQGTIQFDSASQEAVLRYLRQSNQQLERYIRPFEETSQPLILWGIGASTAQLLNSAFDNCHVIQLIDKNPSRQGLIFKTGKRWAPDAGVVQSPESISNYKATIMVLPVMYKDSIVSQIRQMGLTNDIATLKE